MAAISRFDRLAGGLYGLLIGDAVGVPYEFHRPGSLPPFEEIELIPPSGFPRAHPSAPPGAWSDDGAQALCLLESLLHHGRLDVDDFGRRLVNWLRWGYLAAEGKVFDVGLQTSRAIEAIESGVSAERSGPGDEHENGNGSLMRVLPLALWHRGTDEELFADAMRQSLPTHGHLRSQLCCGLYCLWARRTLDRSASGWQEAEAATRELARADGAWQRELEEHIEPARLPGGSGSGYVVDCLHSARLALEESSFEAVVRRAVSIGWDTDTTAAVAGGIAGLRHGIAGIPDRWRHGLAEPALVEDAVRRLVVAAGP